MQAILVGFMGSGKTTIGSLLAQQLRTQHYDLDDLIVQQSGRSITEIFAQSGEEYFRHLEQQTLSQALTNKGILSTGGGTPTIAPNAAVLKASSTPVIWLTAKDQTILERVTQDQSRPLVNDLDQNSLLQLKQKRETLYAAVADLTITTDYLTPLQIVQKIQEWLPN